MDQRADPGEAVVVKAILDDTIALYTRVRGMDPAPIIRAGPPSAEPSRWAASC